MLLIAIFVSCIMIWGIIYIPVTISGQDGMQGFVPAAIGITAHALMLGGGIYACPYTNPTVEGVLLQETPPLNTISKRSDRPVLILLTGVRMIIGDMGSIDMSFLEIEVISSRNSGTVHFSNNPPLSPSSWTISSKTGIIPLSSADNDNILEPGEQFDLLIYPKGLIRPGERFTIRISPPGSVPFSITRTLPSTVKARQFLGT